MNGRKKGQFLYDIGFFCHNILVLLVLIKIAIIILDFLTNAMRLILKIDDPAIIVLIILDLLWMIYYKKWEDWSRNDDF